MQLALVPLRLFVTVMGENTVAAAAERGHRVASAVSRRLAKLDDSLWGGLFTRCHCGKLVLVAPAGHAMACRRPVRLADARPYDVIGAHPGSAIHHLWHRAASAAQARRCDALRLRVAAGLGARVLQALAPAVRQRLAPLARPDSAVSTA
ncbi:MAG: LysR family transcriptional regulator [Burkholderiaceae bacterium]